MMSGPYCKTCKYFMTQPLTPKYMGLCYDPQKRIYDRSGNTINSKPDVHEKFECDNWRQKDEN